MTTSLNLDEIVPLRAFSITNSKHSLKVVRPLPSQKENWEQKTIKRGKKSAENLIYKHDKYNLENIEKH